MLKRSSKISVSKNGYKISEEDNRVPVKSKVLSEQERLAFSTEKYNEIFPEFDKTINSVDDDGKSHFGEVISVLKKTKEEELKPGVYKLSKDYNYFELTNLSLKRDQNYVDLNSKIGMVPQDIIKFFQEKELYEKEGLVHKRGILISGPPGNGKTLEIIRICEKLSKEADIVALIADKGFNSYDDLIMIRENTDLPIIIVIEEIGERLEGNRTEGFLSFMDGEFSIENCVVVATTNYPEKLAPNIVKRPGRFDMFINVQNPDDKERMIFLGAFLGEEKAKLLTPKTKNFSIAFLRELILLSKRYKEKSYEEIINDLKEHITESNKATGQKTISGFGEGDLD